MPNGNNQEPPTQEDRLRRQLKQFGLRRSDIDRDPRLQEAEAIRESGDNASADRLEDRVVALALWEKKAFSPFLESPITGKSLPRQGVLTLFDIKNLLERVIMVVPEMVDATAEDLGEAEFWTNDFTGTTIRGIGEAGPLAPLFGLLSRLVSPPDLTIQAWREIPADQAYLLTIRDNLIGEYDSLLRAVVESAAGILGDRSAIRDVGRIDDIVTDLIQWHSAPQLYDPTELMQATKQHFDILTATALQLILRVELKLGELAENPGLTLSDTTEPVIDLQYIAQLTEAQLFNLGIIPGTLDYVTPKEASDAGGLTGMDFFVSIFVGDAALATPVIFQTEADIRREFGELVPVFRDPRRGEIIQLGLPFALDEGALRDKLLQVDLTATQDSDVRHLINQAPAAVQKILQDEPLSQTETLLTIRAIQELAIQKLPTLSFKDAARVKAFLSAHDVFEAQIHEFANGIALTAVPGPKPFIGATSSLSKSAVNITAKALIGGLRQVPARKLAKNIFMTLDDRLSPFVRSVEFQRKISAWETRLVQKGVSVRRARYLTMKRFINKARDLRTESEFRILIREVGENYMSGPLQRRHLAVITKHIGTGLDTGVNAGGLSVSKAWTMWAAELGINPKTNLWGSILKGRAPEPNVFREAFEKGMAPYRQLLADVEKRYARFWRDLERFEVEIEGQLTKTRPRLPEQFTANMAEASRLSRQLLKTPDARELARLQRLWRTIEQDAEAAAQQAVRPFRGKIDSKLLDDTESLLSFDIKNLAARAETVTGTTAGTLEALRPPTPNPTALTQAELASQTSSPTFTQIKAEGATFDDTVGALGKPNRPPAGTPSVKNPNRTPVSTVGQKFKAEVPPGTTTPGSGRALTETDLEALQTQVQRAERSLNKVSADLDATLGPGRALLPDETVFATSIRGMKQQLKTLRANPKDTTAFRLLQARFTAIEGRIGTLETQARAALKVPSDPGTIALRETLRDLGALFKQIPPPLLGSPTAGVLVRVGRVAVQRMARQAAEMRAQLDSVLGVGRFPKPAERALRAEFDDILKVMRDLERTPADPVIQAEFAARLAALPTKVQAFRAEALVGLKGQTAAIRAVETNTDNIIRNQEDLNALVQREVGEALKNSIPGNITTQDMQLLLQEIQKSRKVQEAMLKYMELSKQVASGKLSRTAARPLLFARIRDVSEALAERSGVARALGLTLRILMSPFIVLASVGLIFLPIMLVQQTAEFAVWGPGMYGEQTGEDLSGYGRQGTKKFRELQLALIEAPKTVRDAIRAKNFGLAAHNLRVYEVGVEQLAVNFRQNQQSLLNTGRLADALTTLNIQQANVRGLRALLEAAQADTSKAENKREGRSTGKPSVKMLNFLKFLIRTKAVDTEVAEEAVPNFLEKVEKGTINYTETKTLLDLFAPRDRDDQGRLPEFPEWLPPTEALTNTPVDQRNRDVPVGGRPARGPSTGSSGARPG